MPMKAMARPPSAGPRMAPPVQTAARPRGAARGVLDRDDLGLEGREGGPLEAGRDADEEDDREDARQADACSGRATAAASARAPTTRSDARDEDDASAGRADRRRGRRRASGPRAGMASTSPSRPSASGSPRDLVRLERHDRGDGRDAERRQPARPSSARNSGAAAAPWQAMAWPKREDVGSPS